MMTIRYARFNQNGQEPFMPPELICVECGTNKDVQIVHRLQLPNGTHYITLASPTSLCSLCMIEMSKSFDSAIKESAESRMTNNGS